MTTQTTSHPDTTVPPAPKLPVDGCSVMDTIEAAAPELNAKVRHAVESGKARVSDWKSEILDKPIKSAFIAAGVGAVIGLIAGLRAR